MILLRFGSVRWASLKMASKCKEVGEGEKVGEVGGEEVVVGGVVGVESEVIEVVGGVGWSESSKKVLVGGNWYNLVMGGQSTELNSNQLK